MELLAELNLEQKKAVTYQEGPFLIVAGAGTGKTTVITRRLAWLISEKKVKTDEVLALTFTDKAAQEMEERAEVLLPMGFFDLWVMTFHSFGERILKEHALAIGLPNNFKLLNETEQWLLLRENLDCLELDYYQPKGNPTRFLQALIKHFSRVKDEDISPEEYLKYAQELTLDKDTEQEEKNRILELAKAYKTYQDLLLENNALDFGDLITYTIKLFKTRPHILKKYQQQFKYILVDEFQDTNLAQYDLVKMLAQPKNNLTVVGDDSQSIYKFRGAAVSNILTFKKDFPQAKEIVLMENYRSGQNILDLAHKFIKQNEPNTLEYKLGIRKNIKSQKGQTSIIEYLAWPTQHEEAKGIIEKIISLKTADSSLFWDDFAVLVRANDQAQQFIPYFERASIPYQFLASKGLFSKPVILDILSFLRLLDNYHESRALFRFLNLPHLKIPYEDILTLMNHASRFNLSLYETLKISRTLKLQKRTYKIIDHILSLIEELTNLTREKTVGQVVLAFLEKSNYLKYLTTQEEIKTQESVLYLNQFYRQIEEFEAATDDKSVKNFISKLNLISEAGERGDLQTDIAAGPEAVKIMTVHGAKGLEFNYVFLVNLVEHRFPTIERKEAIELVDALVREILPEGDIHLQEERRLFYVAMTRAKKGLFFSWAEDYGGKRKKRPSRFLIELGLVPKYFPPPKPTGEVFFKQEKIKPLLPKPYTLPHKFSYTQLKAYQTCPHQYRFTHILRIPVPGRFSLSFGKTMHNTLCQFFKKLLTGGQKDIFGKKQKVCLTEEDLLRLYKENWIGEWYDSQAQEEKYKKDGLRALKDFYALHAKNWPKVKYLEKAFNLKINQYLIKGVIDRIDDLGEKKVEIVDYKTGNVPKTPKEDIEQLWLYALALKEVFAEIPERLTYYYLEANKPISYSVEEEKLKYAQEWVLKLIEKILSQNFDPTPGYHCQYCDFQNICEHRA